MKKIPKNLPIKEFIFICYSIFITAYTIKKTK